MMLPMIILLVVAGAAGSLLIQRRGIRATALAASAATVASLVLLLSEAPAVTAGRIVIVSSAWVPTIGLYLSFRLDGLSLVLALLVLGVGLLIIV
jgi:multicomponent K+:H+ antiporter subunit A